MRSNVDEARLMPWYALRSKRSKEESLWRQVGARGYEGYYPCVRVRHVNARARKLRPYFPGYIFVRVNHPIVGMSLFSSVPDGLLDAIRLRVDEINVSGSEELHEQRKHASIFKEGDKVVINDGPFAGY